MKNKKINDKLANYLNLIVAQYIKNGEPISSKSLIDEHNLRVSSATIRNAMAKLEELDYLTKAHISSGRIPSTKGYKFYAIHLKSNENLVLKRRLENIFAKRWINIDMIIEKSAKAIQEIIGLTLVTKSDNRNELLKSINLTHLNNNNAIIVLVTSSGRVKNKILHLNEYTKINDVQIAIRIFKERLMDTRIYDLDTKVLELEFILREQIKNYESIIQSFVHDVFNFTAKQDTHIYGKNEIIKQNEISRGDVIKLLEKIENESIWESIQSETTDDQTLKIDIKKNNTSFISKKLELNNSVREISIIGSNRMDYPKAKAAIQMLERILKK